MATGRTGAWARPYPVEADTPPDVAADLQALATSLDTTPLFPTTAATSRNGVAGESVVVSPSQTLTLPSAPTKGDTLRVIAGSTVTGATQVVVAASGGKGINGLGLSVASSFKLGTPFAHATLQYDGTNWQIIDGQQDTGSVALTLGTGITAAAIGYTPSARLRGNTVLLSGILKNNTGGTASIGTLLATAPSFAIPAQETYYAAQETAGLAGGAFMEKTGEATPGGIFNTNTITSAHNLSLDGWQYRLS